MVLCVRGAQTSATEKTERLGNCSGTPHRASDDDAAGGAGTGAWVYAVVALAAVICVACVVAACIWLQGRQTVASFGATGIAMSGLALHRSPTHEDGELYGSAGPAENSAADATYAEFAETSMGLNAEAVEPRVFSNASAHAQAACAGYFVRNGEQRCAGVCWCWCRCWLACWRWCVHACTRDHVCACRPRAGLRGVDVALG